jgi:hypothetical protein
VGVSEQAPIIKLPLTVSEVAKAIPIRQRKCWELTNRAIFPAVGYDAQTLRECIAAQQQKEGRP